MEDNLFLLLRIGLEIEHPTDEAINLLAGLTFEEWIQLKELAARQGVAAIAFDGLNSISQQYGKEVMCPMVSPDQWQVFLLEWMAYLFMFEQSNVLQIQVMNDLAKKWREAGFKVMIMKGQANGTLYPHPNHRSKGDIDCYLFENYAKGNEVARQIGAKVDMSWYKHSVISYKGESFENHQFFVHTRDGKGGKLLEKELESLLRVDASEFRELTPWTLMPPVQWTALFLTYHACSHFISEGLNLKQVLDWTMFLKKYQNDVDWNVFYKSCDRHHLSRFADVSTAIAVKYLGIKIDNGNIRVDSPYTEKVLKSALYDDDYVFGSGKGNWYNRLHLVKNLWTYRWKYRDIYEMSPLRQFWYYATGFIFKTE
ncbi:MAG: nucleotidyltransferase family protein [Bacteroidales bacterium]|nr:nucleotidyltransferase family protein [Bacteroidales bacterium]